MDRNAVNEAFEILLMELETAVNALNEEGARSFRAGDYASAGSLLEQGNRLKELREKVQALQKEWNALPTPAAPAKAPPPAPRRRVSTRIPRGQRTPEDAYRRPILEALVELGDSAPAGTVLDRVGEKMKGILRPRDFEGLPSSPRSIRWRNTAQWCRNSLMKEGLMKNDSPPGTWEITEKGRRWLSDNPNP